MAVDSSHLLMTLCFNHINTLTAGLSERGTINMHAESELPKEMILGTYLLEKIIETELHTTRKVRESFRSAEPQQDRVMTRYA